MIEFVRIPQSDDSISFPLTIGCDTSDGPVDGSPRTEKSMEAKGIKTVLEHSAQCSFDIERYVDTCKPIIFAIDTHPRLTFLYRCMIPGMYSDGDDALQNFRLKRRF